MKIYWLAVHKTPYNEFLFEELKKNWDISIIYEKSHIKNLNFELEKSKLLNFRLYKNLIFSKDLVIITGWNSFLKISIILMRGIFKLPTMLWTDTVKENVYEVSIINEAKRILLSRLDAIITTGDIGVQRFKASKIKPGRVEVYSLPFFVPIPTVAKETISKDGVINFLMVNRLIPRKGIEDTIRVIEGLKNQGFKISLRIAGLGPLEHNLRTIIKNLSLENEAELVGWLSREELMSYMLASDYLIHLPSKIDPFPLVVLESLALGLPVISNRFAGSALERINQGKNGLLVPCDVSTIVSTLIVENIHLQSRKGKMQSQAREQSLTWNGDMARKMFNEVLNKVYGSN